VQRWSREVVGAKASNLSPRARTVMWSLVIVTAPDEQERCCVLVDGQRCERPTAYHVASMDGVLDDYAYVCTDDLQLVSRALYAVTRVKPTG
jgi:hypothetical protein